MKSRSWDNLPVPLTSFIGRDADLHALDELLADPECRLISLLGPGEIGKTRCAIEAARRSHGRFADGGSAPLVPGLTESLERGTDVLDLGCGQGRALALMAQDGAGVDTMWGEELALAMLSDAGFTDTQIEQLPHDFTNHCYIARKG